VIESGALSVASYIDSAATFYRATTACGRTYFVVVAAEAGVALVQAAGTAGWAEVSLADLRLSDACGLQVAAAVIDAALIR